MQQNQATILGNLDTLRGEVGVAIRQTLGELGIVTLGVDAAEATALSPSIIDSIAKAIISSDFIVADISKLSPNLSYELGLAHGMRKPTILIMDQESLFQIPSELAGYLLLFYDRYNLVSFQNKLRNSAAHYVTLSHA